jgi:hypothetical protein
MNAVAISFVLTIQFLLVGICWCGSCEEEKCAMIDHILKRNTVNAKRGPSLSLPIRRCNSCLLVAYDDGVEVVKKRSVF